MHCWMWVLGTKLRPSERAAYSYHQAPLKKQKQTNKKKTNKKNQEKHFIFDTHFYPMFAHADVKLQNLINHQHHKITQLLNVTLVFRFKTDNEFLHTEMWTQYSSPYRVIVHIHAFFFKLAYQLASVQQKWLSVLFNSQE